MTDSETILWTRIRKNQINRVRFHRQRVLGPYVVDFYAPSIRLVIEVDGPYHSKIENIEKDRIRDQYFADTNIRVIRFKNDQIQNDLENVIEDIYKEILKL
jgi:very-short-patch-repair endonuclease